MKIWKNTNTLDHQIPGLAELSVGPEEAEIAIIGSRAFDLESLPRLRAIFKCGVGTDNIPFEACRARGIEVVLPSEATANVIFEETANYAVYLVLDRLYFNKGDWEAWKKRNRPLLGDRRVLVIGKGKIGGRVFEKLEPLARVDTYDILEDPEESLEKKIRQAEVVSLHIPLIEKTRAWFDREKLSWMPDGAALVNTARGPLVDEDALYHELHSKRLSAAFDVFWEEPYRGKLTGIDPERFKRSPHIASTCLKFHEGLAADFTALFQRFNRL